MTYTYNDYVIDIDKLKNSSNKEIEAVLDNLVYKAYKEGIKLIYKAYKEMIKNNFSKQNYDEDKEVEE